MKMLSILNLLSVCVCCLSLLHGTRAQNCLQADGNTGNLPTLESLGFGVPRITQRHVAIVASYQFSCCGNVTEWGAGVEPSGDIFQGTYSISFQVWRPSPTVKTTECYSLVGQNRFTSVTLIDQLIRETPIPEERIAFQPNDVVGFLIESARDIDNGVTLNTENYDSEEVWYGSIDDAIARPPDCPFPVGTQSNRFLRTSTNAAPLISVSLATGSCPPLIIPTTSSQPSHNPTTSVATMQSRSPFLQLSTTDTLLPSPTPLSPPPSTPSQPSPSTPSLSTPTHATDDTTQFSDTTPETHAPSTNNSPLLIGVVSGSIAAGVAMVIVVIAIIVCVGAAKKNSYSFRTRNLRSDNSELEYNKAYITNHMSILTEKNEAYGKTTLRKAEEDPTDTLYSSPEATGYMYVNEPEIPTVGNTAYGTTAIASSGGRAGATATNTQAALIESEGGRGGSHDNDRHGNSEDEYDYISPQL